jgi:putative flippase GtrA/tetratricopeptide (TPR) repeat protein
MARTSLHVAVEGLRYLAAAAAALAVDFGVYVALIRLGGVSYVVAAPIGFALGLVAIYALSIRWVFDHRRLPNARSEFLIFTSIGVAGMVLNQGVIMLGVEKLSLSYELAKALSALTVFGFNFGVRKLMLFTPPAAPANIPASAPAAVPGQDEVARMVIEGMQAHYEGDLVRARETYERVLGMDATNVDALYLMGELETRRAAWTEAAVFFRRALAQDAKVAAFHAGLGTALRAVGKIGQASDCFRRALRLDPKCAEAYIGLGMGLEATGNLVEAHHYYRRWLETRIEQGERGAPIAASAQRKDVPGTTLCCIDSRPHELARLALARSLARCRFTRAILISDADVHVEGVETVRVPPIRTAQDHAHCVMKELDRYIDTDFVLLIQYDAFVLNADRWSADFHRCDYVGAPWAEGDAGDGAFSLRSKRLLRALQDPQIKTRAPDDVAICRTYRALLEQKHGIRFADAALAGRFSFANVAPQASTFGFHGVAHLARLFDLSDEEIAAYRPPASALQRA